MLTDHEQATIQQRMGPLVSRLEALSVRAAQKDTEIVVLRNAYENLSRQVEDVVKVIKSQNKC